MKYIFYCRKQPNPMKDMTVYVEFIDRLLMITLKIRLFVFSVNILKTNKLM